MKSTKPPGANFFVCPPRLISPFLINRFEGGAQHVWWAKKGVWRTAATEDVTERRLGDWFRIGFEPMFADFTQSGSWFAVYAVLEVRA